MKALRHKSLMGLLYAVLLAIPMLSIISRVIYVQSNKNAFQSYSNQLVEQKISITNTNQMQDGLTYNMQFDNTQEQGYTGRFGFKELSFDLYDLFPNMVQRNYVAFLFYGNNQDCIWYFDNNGTLDTYYYGSAATSFPNFSFVLDMTYTQTNAVINKWNCFTYTFIQEKLDNVFEYSVDSIIQGTNFGKVDFLSWFSNMFLDNTNSVNNRYVHFANWYLNYVMFISCVYLLFLVLMWFINFARRLLDRGMNYDW